MDLYSAYILVLAKLIVFIDYVQKERLLVTNQQLIFTLPTSKSINDRRNM